MAEWENRLGQDSPLARALRLAMPEDMRNPLLHPESVNHFALPPQQPRAELRNPAPRPGDYLSPVSEALSPTMGAYGLGNALGDAYVKGREGDYKGMASPLAEILLSMAPVPGMKKGAMPPRVENPIKAYHGSRYDFTEFNVPTFVAQHEPVAAGYKPVDGGHMYEVNVHARPELFVDPATPFNQQSEAVRNAFASKLDDLRRSGVAVDRHPVLANPEQHSLFEMSSALSDYFSPEHLLKGAGVPGFRHPAPGAPKSAPNLEVFDPTIIEILRKYGLLGPVAAGATANALMGAESEQ